MHLDCLNIDGMSSDSVSPRGLAVVDDSKLRKELFSTSANLLKKIHQLEKVHANFLNFDQLLYQDWYNVTFRKELQALDHLERRLKSLSTFQVHLQYIARTSQISLKQAYALLKQEEVQYQTEDEDWRFIIESLRQQRYENATKASKTLSSEEGAIQTYAPADLLQSEQSPLSRLSRHERSTYHYLSDIEDAAMARHVADPSAGFELFKESFQIAMKCGDWKLLARIWKAGGPIFQGKLLKPMPAHLKDFLQQAFNENEKKGPTAMDREADIQLRSSYRKLVRLLHPDRLGDSDKSETHKEWATKKWQKVQTIYAAGDHVGLRHLELICFAELGQLNHLTLNEIYQSSLILAEELETLKKNLKVSRKHPAWNFSSRRVYSSLALRVRKEIALQSAQIGAQVNSLEMQMDRLSQDSQT